MFISIQKVNDNAKDWKVSAMQAIWASGLIFTQIHGILAQKVHAYKYDIRREPKETNYEES